MCASLHPPPPTRSNRQLVIKNVKCMFLKWNMILLWATRAVKCEVFAYEEREQIVFPLYLETVIYFRHFHRIVKNLPAQSNLLQEKH